MDMRITKHCDACKGKGTIKVEGKDIECPCCDGKKYEVVILHNVIAYERLDYTDEYALDTKY